MSAPPVRPPAATVAWLDRASERAAVKAGLTVESIKVDGRHWTDRAALRDALKVARGQSLLHLDLTDMRRRVEALGWVESADLYRTLPNRLNLKVTERTPFAVWQYEGELKLIDPTGTVIVSASPADFRDLPLVVGKGAADDAAELETMLSAEPALSKRVKAAVRVGDRRWNIRFKNGVEARLPAQNPREAWRRLARLEQQHALLQRNILHVDLRLEDRLVVRRRAVRFRLSGQEI